MRKAESPGKGAGLPGRSVTRRSLRKQVPITVSSGHPHWKERVWPKGPQPDEGSQQSNHAHGSRRGCVAKSPNLGQRTQQPWPAPTAGKDHRQRL